MKIVMLVTVSLMLVANTSLSRANCSKPLECYEKAIAVVQSYDEKIKNLTEQTYILTQENVLLKQQIGTLAASVGNSYVPSNLSCRIVASGHPHPAKCVSGEIATGGACKCDNAVFIHAGGIPLADGFKCNNHCTHSEWNWKESATAYAVCCKTAR